MPILTTALHSRFASCGLDNFADEPLSAVRKGLSAATIWPVPVRKGPKVNDVDSEASLCLHGAANPHHSSSAFPPAAPDSRIVDGKSKWT